MQYCSKYKTFRVQSGAVNPGVPHFTVAICHISEKTSAVPGDIESTVMVEDAMTGYVLLQVRDNGKFGLPGGKVEEDERPRDAIARELAEEHGVDVSKHCTSLKELAMLHVYQRTRDDLIYHRMGYESYLHVFIMDIPLDRREVCRLSATASDFGRELLGIAFFPKNKALSLGDQKHTSIKKVQRNLLSGNWEFPHREILKRVQITD